MHWDCQRATTVLIHTRSLEEGQLMGWQWRRFYLFIFSINYWPVEGYQRSLLFEEADQYLACINWPQENPCRQLACDALPVITPLNEPKQSTNLLPHCWIFVEHVKQVPLFFPPLTVQWWSDGPCCQKLREVGAGSRWAQLSQVFAILQEEQGSHEDGSRKKLTPTLLMENIIKRGEYYHNRILLKIYIFLYADLLSH